MGELQRAQIEEEGWSIYRDGFRNVTATSRSGGAEGELVTTWREGLPVEVSSGEDSMAVEQCTDTDCHVELVVDNRTTRLAYTESSITATSGDRETVFARDEQGLITEGCQEIDERQVCTDWLAEGKVGDRAELARSKNSWAAPMVSSRGLPPVRCPSIRQLSPRCPTSSGPRDWRSSSPTKNSRPRSPPPGLCSPRPTDSTPMAQRLASLDASRPHPFSSPRSRSPQLGRRTR